MVAGSQRMVVYSPEHEGIEEEITPVTKSTAAGPVEAPSVGVVVGSPEAGASSPVASPDSPTDVADLTNQLLPGKGNKSEYLCWGKAGRSVSAVNQSSQQPVQ